MRPPRPRPFREPGIEAGDPIPLADDGLDHRVEIVLG